MSILPQPLRFRFRMTLACYIRYSYFVGRLRAGQRLKVIMVVSHRNVSPGARVWWASAISHLALTRNAPENRVLHEFLSWSLSPEGDHSRILVLPHHAYWLVHTGGSASVVAGEKHCVGHFHCGIPHQDSFHLAGQNHGQKQ